MVISPSILAQVRGDQHCIHTLWLIEGTDQDMFWWLKEQTAAAPSSAGASSPSWWADMFYLRSSSLSFSLVWSPFSRSICPTMAPPSTATF